MTGKSHLITNVSSVVIIGNGISATNRHFDGRFAQQIASFPPWTYVWERPDAAILAAGLFLLGSLLPDIDSKKSLLGRYLHIPVEHRTWTHAIWLPLLFFIMTFAQPVFFWLGLGYVLHLLWDDLSVGGVCFLYPLTKYRRYDSGAKVKRGHWFRLYRTGNASEYVIVIFMVVLAVLSIFLKKV